MQDSQPAKAVRPTKRALSDLKIPIPPIDLFLNEIDNPHVVEAQKLPAIVDCNGAERVVSIRDRVWFKYKSTDIRAAITQLKETEVSDDDPAKPLLWLGRWWIGATGHRVADSGQADFYSQLEKECSRQGGSEHLLPDDWDRKRIRAELAVLTVRNIKKVVLDLIAMSMQSGKAATGVAANHYITAHVSQPTHDEAYLVLGAGGIHDAKIVAIILDSVPGVSHENWEIEPPGRFGSNPADGELVYSAYISIEVQSEILDQTDVSGLL